MTTVMNPVTGSTVAVMLVSMGASLFPFVL
jgi:hypothetical protein